jgi:hypothetical protein
MSVLLLTLAPQLSQRETSRDLKPKGEKHSDQGVPRDHTAQTCSMRVVLCCMVETALHGATGDVTGHPWGRG